MNEPSLEQEADAIRSFFLNRISQNPPGAQFVGFMTEFSGNGEPIVLEMWRDGGRTWLRPSPPPIPHLREDALREVER